MKITKVINNNTVATIANKKEVILTGAGIGFHMQAGDTVDVEKIEKVFQVRDRFAQRYEQIWKHISPQYFKIAEQIRIYAEEQLRCTLSQQFVFSLADHISFAVERQKKGEPLPNLMLYEIQMLYANEFRIGEYGKQLVEKEAKIILPIDEAGYFALHIVNSRMGETSMDVNNILVLTNGILNIVHENMEVHCKEGDFEYNRFLLHLKFLAKRIFNQEQNQLCVVGSMYPELLEREPGLESVLKKIKNFIKETFDYEITREEATYLAVHIIRIKGN